MTDELIGRVGMTETPKRPDDAPKRLSEERLAGLRQWSTTLARLGDLDPQAVADLLSHVDALEAELVREKDRTLDLKDCTWREGACAGYHCPVDNLCFACTRRKLEAELAWATQANMAVAVCQQHTSDILGDGCVICELKRLREPGPCGKHPRACYMTLEEYRGYPGPWTCGRCGHRNAASVMNCERGCHDGFVVDLPCAACKSEEKAVEEAVASREDELVRFECLPGCSEEQGCDHRASTRR